METKLDPFYCRFEEGAEQFRFDVAQNPNDTEESIWCFLCEAPLYGVDEARKRFLEASSCFYFLPLGSSHENGVCKYANNYHLSK